VCLGDETEEIERSSDRIAEVSTSSQCPSGEAEVVDGVTTIQGCVQIRQACSVGVSPTGVKAMSPVARIAGWRETEILKPIDKAI